LIKVQYHATPLYFNIPGNEILLPAGTTKINFQASDTFTLIFIKLIYTMKNSTPTILVTLLISTVIFSACESGGENNNPGKIRYAGTLAGGCNGQLFNDLKAESAGEQPDTSWYRVSDDSLVFFSGLNYICCTPYTTSADIRNDSLIMTITDTCNLEEDHCYCKCMCYYTFEFIFLDYSGEHYSYLISCYDRRAQELIILGDGQL
jgi:hypothetical protein